MLIKAAIKVGDSYLNVCTDTILVLIVFYKKKLFNFFLLLLYIIIIIINNKIKLSIFILNFLFFLMKIQICKVQKHTLMKEMSRRLNECINKFTLTFFFIRIYCINILNRSNTVITVSSFVELLFQI